MKIYIPIGTVYKSIELMIYTLLHFFCRCYFFSFSLEKGEKLFLFQRVKYVKTIHDGNKSPIIFHQQNLLNNSKLLLPCFAPCSMIFFTSEHHAQRMSRRVGKKSMLKVGSHNKFLPFFRDDAHEFTHSVSSDTSVPTMRRL